MIHHLKLNSILSQEEYSKYSRQIILNNIGTQGQQRLKEAKILFIGAGGLACPCITYMAASGIGCIGIIDKDTISISNLHRQTLYGNGDINKPKTEIAKKKINQINPLCQVDTYPYELTDCNAPNLFRRYDIIIDTSDNFSTRYIIDTICYQLHKVHIYGAIENFEGQISVFNYKSGPRYSDLYPKHLHLEDKTCNHLGVLGVLPGIIGILQATEVIKIITGIGKVLSGSIGIYDALNMSFKKIKIHTIKKCNMQNSSINDDKIVDTNTIFHIAFKSKQKMYSGFLFIDVRQKTEFAKEHINNAINIPLKEIHYKHNIKLLKNYSQKNNIVVYCSHDSRSIIASNLLSKHHIQHYRLVQGLHEWIINKKQFIKVYE